MSNRAGARTRREEEIAFLAMEQVLGVDIKLADAGGGSKKPDGSWTTSRGQGVVEVTSPPAKALMVEWARAKRVGCPQTESGSVPLRLNELADVCAQLLEAGWAVENIKKLQGQVADERHLFLFARGQDIGGYFHRLSDSYEDGTIEHVDDIVLPEGISDVWFQGRARREPGEVLGTTHLWLARFKVGVGWQRHIVQMEELALPSPAPGIADDPVHVGLRRPKDRS